MNIALRDADRGLGQRNGIDRTRIDDRVRSLPSLSRVVGVIRDQVAIEENELATEPRRMHHRTIECEPGHEHLDREGGRRQYEWLREPGRSAIE